MMTPDPHSLADCVPELPDHPFVRMGADYPGLALLSRASVLLGIAHFHAGAFRLPAVQDLFR